MLTILKRLKPKEVLMLILAILFVCLFKCFFRFKNTRLHVRYYDPVIQSGNKG